MTNHADKRPVIAMPLLKLKGHNMKPATWWLDLNNTFEAAVSIFFKANEYRSTCPTMRDEPPSLLQRKRAVENRLKLTAVHPKLTHRNQERSASTSE